jgi:hypothetical protein
VSVRRPTSCFTVWQGVDAARGAEAPESISTASTVGWGPWRDGRPNRDSTVTHMERTARDLVGPQDGYRQG